MTENQLFNVRLIAIAKDEAAYLPEWIFHHLSVGFDSVEVYVNNTSDNTWELSSHLASLKQVSFIDADPTFDEFPRYAQETVYKQAFVKAQNDKCTHIMFLDIDEFWISLDKHLSVKEFLTLHPHKNIFSFNWLCKFNELEFSSIYESEIVGRYMRQVKTLFSTSIEIEKIDVHNVCAPKEKYYFSNGNEWSFPHYHKNASHIKGPFFNPTKQSIFVLHRMFRSELEYVSMLYRGNPNLKDKLDSVFKNNRHGYIGHLALQKAISFDVSYLTNFKNEFDLFLKGHGLESFMQEARRFVYERYKQTLSTIRQCDASEFDTLNRAMKNITQEEVRIEMDQYNQKIRFLAKKDTIAFLQKAATAAERIDIKLAKDILSKALSLKPDGKYMIDKMSKYEKKLAEK
jgi:hypothetical protein